MNEDEDKRDLWLYDGEGKKIARAQHERITFWPHPMFDRDWWRKNPVQKLKNVCYTNWNGSIDVLSEFGIDFNTTHNMLNSYFKRNRSIRVALSLWSCLSWNQIHFDLIFMRFCVLCRFLFQFYWCDINRLLKMACNPSGSMDCKGVFWFHTSTEINGKYLSHLNEDDQRESFRFWSILRIYNPDQIDQ